MTIPATISRIGATLLAMLRTRLELATLELQEETHRLFGYVAWGWLLARHPASVVTPMALLVPVFGMAASAWWLGEPLPAWKLAAAALVIGGLALNVFGPRVLARRQVAR